MYIRNLCTRRYTSRWLHPFFCHALLAPHVEQRTGAVRTEQCCIKPCGACCTARLCRASFLIGFPGDIISHIYGWQRSPAVHRAAAIQRTKFQAPGLAGVPDAARRSRAGLSLSHPCLDSPYPRRLYLHHGQPLASPILMCSSVHCDLLLLSRYVDLAGSEEAKMCA